MCVPLLCTDGSSRQKTFRRFGYLDSDARTFDPQLVLRGEKEAKTLKRGLRSKMISFLIYLFEESHNCFRSLVRFPFMSVLSCTRSGVAARCECVYRLARMVSLLM